MLSFLGIISVILGIIICGLLYKRREANSGLCVDENHAFEVVRLVEALREICPPGSERGWQLLPTFSVSRCWSRTFPFNFLDSKINLTSSSMILNYSATSILNIIADIYSWSEWEPLYQLRHLEAEVSEDPQLHGDFYMQCDQVITMISPASQKPKPGILMHRFGNLESNGVGWILMWQIHQLDWCFYLCQPVESSGPDNPSSLLSVVRGVNPFTKCKEDIPGQLASKISHLREAIILSKVSVYPFLPVIPLPRYSLNNPHLPTIRSALFDTPNTPCVLLKPAQDKETGSRPAFKTKNHLLALVPFAQKKPVNLRTLRGFVLVPLENKGRKLIGSKR